MLTSKLIQIPTNCTMMKETEKNHKIPQNIKLVWVR